jgi:hypothetical protein
LINCNVSERAVQVVRVKVAGTKKNKYPHIGLVQQQKKGRRKKILKYTTKYDAFLKVVVFTMH